MVKGAAFLSTYHAATDRVTCTLCPHACVLASGEKGWCRSRICRDHALDPLYYGQVSSLALDPIEKKPLYHFHPGSRILSVGSFACNMHCPFCQNAGISQVESAPFAGRQMSPEELVHLALSLQSAGNLGLAFTYNEPLINYEYLWDTARLAKRYDLAVVLVTNGLITARPLKLLLPYISAMNIDLKCFTEEGYRSLGGDLPKVKTTLRLSQPVCHVEVTTLVVPGLSDAPEDMAREAAFLASLDAALPLHLSRYFPSYQASFPPTDLSVMRELQQVAEQHLQHVYLGNVWS